MHGILTALGLWHFTDVFRWLRLALLSAISSFVLLPLNGSPHLNKVFALMCHCSGTKNANRFGLCAARLTETSVAARGILISSLGHTQPQPRLENWSCQRGSDLIMIPSQTSNRVCIMGKWSTNLHTWWTFKRNRAATGLGQPWESEQLHVCAPCFSPRGPLVCYTTF